MNARVREVRRYPDAEVPGVVLIMNARARSLVSTICFITLSGLPHERAVFSDENKDGAGGGGGGNNTEKKLELTQAQLDAMITDRLKKATAESADAKAKLDEAAKKLAELQAKADELELKGKSAEEKARIAAEKAAAKIEADKLAAFKERDEAKAIAEASQKALRSHIVGAQLSEALVAAKALPTSLKHASPAFLAEVELDTDETHKITGVRLGGVAHKTLADAATEWLKHNSHFAQVQGGTGHRVGSGAGGPSNQDRPVNDLFAEGMAELNQR